MELGTRAEWYKNCPDDKWATDCPLCKKNDLVIWESNHWIICHNKYPVLDLKNHFMAVPKRHVVLTKDLSIEEYAEFQSVEEHMNILFENQSYFSTIREDRESRSLEHLHYHFLPGKLQYSHLEHILQNQ